MSDWFIPVVVIGLGFILFGDYKEAGIIALILLLAAL